MNGQGKMIWKDREGSIIKSYEGGLINDKPSGWGVKIVTGKLKLEGEWLNGMLHGKFTKTFLDQARVERCTYHKGKLESFLDITFPSGSRF